MTTTPAELADLRAAAESLPSGYDYVLEKDEVLDLLDHIAKLEAENVSLRGNCARMRADAKDATKKIKRMARKADSTRIRDAENVIADMIEECAKSCEVQKLGTGIGSRHGKWRRNAPPRSDGKPCAPHL